MSLEYISRYCSLNERLCTQFARTITAYAGTCSKLAIFPSNRLLCMEEHANGLCILQCTCMLKLSELGTFVHARKIGTVL